MAQCADEPVTSESILRAVLDGPRDLMIVATDREFRYIAFNEAHRRGMKARLGVDIELGMNILDFVPEDMAARVRERTRVGEQVVVVEEMGEGDDPLKKHFFEVIHCPIFGPDGAVLGQTVFHKNITAERHMLHELELHRAGLEKRVEERTIALRRSEGLYRTLVQHAPIAVFVHRGNTLLYVNPAAIALCAALDAASLLARPLTDMLPAAPSQGGDASFAEYLIRTFDGRSVDVEWTSLEVELEGGQAMLSLAVDVSSRKRAELERARLEEQMRETQKLESLGVLAGGIAHDFNNLLVGMMGNAELALRALRSGQQGSGLELQLQRIMTAASRAAELTAKMLAYAGQGRFVVREIDLNELAREMVDLASISVPKGAELILDLADDLPAFDGDAAHVGQVVMNLLTNAAEALDPTGGTVCLRTSVMTVGRAGSLVDIVDDELRPGRYVCLEVIDNGAGMDDPTRQRIFDPFFTTKASGRGLGLAAVVGIARAHEGAIRVISTQGLGSTFRALFPANDRKATGTTTAPREEPWRASGTVLVADDEPRVRDVFKMLLADIGFQVLEAASASTCLDVYRANASVIDAVIIDLEMPGGGGREVVRVLRAEGHAVPVVISSGYTSEAIGHELRVDRRLSFLAKPFDHSTFVRTLKGALVP
jgi:signal transduction histidine kinase